MIVKQRNGVPIAILAVLPPDLPLARGCRIVGLCEQDQPAWVGEWYIDGRRMVGRDDSTDLVDLPAELVSVPRP